MNRSWQALIRVASQEILPLSNEIMVNPAHVAGSACGKSMCMPTSDTLGIKDPITD